MSIREIEALAEGIEAEAEFHALAEHFEAERLVAEFLAA